VLFRQLEYFVALARERHFARAAAACFVSQSALSDAIRKLEHELDVPLVVRGHAFEGLTPEGERLVLWAQRILADHDALKQEVTALRSGLSGRLRLGVIPSATPTAARLVAPFCEAHPLVRVSLAESLRSAEIVRRLRAYELDAGLLYPDAAVGPDLARHVLYTEEHVMVASRLAAVVPRAWLRTLAPVENLRVIRLHDPVVRMQIALVTLAATPGPLLLRAFVDSALALPWDDGS
jgi:DNA-binding transcriptional LysR family regulator